MSVYTLRRTLVRDVMTTKVLSVSTDASFDEVARTLLDSGVRAVPVVEDGRPVGVVSEADLARTAELGDPRAVLRPRRPWARRHVDRPRTATELMTSPIVAVRPTASVAEAFRLMRSRNVSWLAVVEPDEQDIARLVGVLGRSDLLGVFLRDDDDLRREVVDQVFTRILLIDPTGVEIAVRDGVVTLAGEVPSRSDAELAVNLVSRLEGVVAVEDGLSYRFAEKANGPLRVPLF